MQAAQRLTGGGDPINGWIGLILYVVFTPAFYAYAQSGLNATWRKVGAQQPEAALSESKCRRWGSNPHALAGTGF